MAEARRRRLLELAFCSALLIPAALVIRELSRVGWSCGALHDFYDVRLLGYLLEWGYRYLGGSDLSDSIWSPPFFFPEENLLAYSDALFTAYPFYFPARWLGANPHQALLFFWVSQLCLTPLVAYGCARWLGLGRFAASICAFTFGWSWARYFQMAHVQFSAGWLVPLFFAFLYRGLRDKRLAWLGAALWTFAGAFFLAVYIAYFFAILTALLLLAAVVLERRHLRGYVCSFWREVTAERRRRELVATAAGLALALSLLAYAGHRYRVASQALGGGDPWDATAYGASLYGWLRPDPENLVWGRLSSLFPPDEMAPWEKFTFMGWVSPLLCLASPLLLRRRSERWFAREREGSALHPTVLLAVSAVVPFVILFISDYPARLDFLESPMALARRYLPGANAIRATGRICLVLSFLSAFVAAAWVQAFSKSKHRSFVFGSGVLAALLVMENVTPIPPVADRCPDDRPWVAIEKDVCELARAKDLGTILFLPADLNSIGRIFGQVPAMTLAMNCGLRSINGYTGHWPLRFKRLFRPRARILPCPALTELVDAAQAKLNKPALIYVEREGPLGPPGYGVEAVSRCLRRCLLDRAPVEIEEEGRKGIGLITDPSRRCADRLP